MKRVLAACAVAVALVLGVPGSAMAISPERTGQTDTGFLDVTSDPPAKIFVDDVDTGKMTPQSHLELKEGHHKLTLVTTDGAHKRTIGFKIDAGQTTKLTLHLAS